ncbi:MAG: SWIM zinc finger family protein [Planctomycetes bacterium]|nr:SWIM zinc finger family protein [Planctomycetota bacterium]
MRHYDDYGFPRYVSVAEKRARARRKLEQLRKQHPNIRPVIIEGNALVRTWWGKAWNGNLSKYADYANRIGRGRSYVRHGAVLDLQIKSGQVKALVQGSQGSPYTVTIKIKPISEPVWKQIRAACAGQLASLQELLEGRFPRGLAELFTAKGSGLFPSPQEIDFHCSCPDWAYMCKHVAAVLYGIGTRLDEDPSLFFVLRRMKMDDLITQAVQDKSERLLKQAKKKTARVLDDADLGEVFGIEMEPAAASEKEGTAAQTAAPTPRQSSLRRTPKKRAK